MTRLSSLVARTFEDATLRIPLCDIVPLREVRADIRKSVKYAQIAASIGEVGIIEPPVVVRHPSEPGKFRLLDGHLRIDILAQQGAGEVVCLIATEDEAITYNRRVSRIAIIQEHKMILAALNRGVPEERLARALNVNIASIRQKRTLLAGICPEAVELLKDKHVPIKSFKDLRKLKPLRQIEAAEMMVAMNQYSSGYIQSIVAASPSDQLVDGAAKAVKGLTNDQIDMMTEESARLDREFRLVEQDYGADHLDLVLASAFVSTLLDNLRVVRHLAQFHASLLQEFQKITELQKAA